MATTPSKNDKTVTLDDLEADMNGTAKPPGKDLDLLEGLDEDLDTGSGRSWAPASEEDGAGTTLVGFVTSTYEVGSDFRPEPVPCIDVEDRDGEVWSVRGYHAALGGQLLRLKPAVGDAVAIRYLGQKENKRGQELQDYAVRVRKAQPKQ